MKLYIYDHCPFCVKARAMAGLKQLPIEEVVLASDDEETPIAMIGQKMLPILSKEDGSHMGESMDIVQYLDAHYGDAPLLKQGTKPEIQAWVDGLFDVVKPLYMATNGMAPFEEFKTTSARAYYTRKKEAMVGPFGEIFADRDTHLSQINAYLALLTPLLEKLKGQDLDETDIHLFGFLRGLTVIRGLKFEPAVADYLQEMSQRSSVALLHEMAG